MRDKGFRAWLYHYRGRKILPIIAFVEFAIFFRSRGKDTHEVRQLMKKMNVEIEPMQGQSADSMVETIIAAGIRPNTAPFYKMWRDHAIAGHAHTAPLIVVTNNVKDFAFLANRVISPNDAMKAF